MVDQYPTLKFYKHTNDKKEIGWNNCAKDRNIIGPNLQQLFDVLQSQGLSERAHTYEQEGGWSGDLYVVHRRVYTFQSEMSRFMGDSGAGGPLVAKVLDVTMNSTQGWAQDLSLIVEGPYDRSIAQRLVDLDFTPGHSFLAKDDNVRGCTDKGVWLDNPDCFQLMMH